MKYYEEKQKNEDGNRNSNNQYTYQNNKLSEAKAKYDTIERIKLLYKDSNETKLMKSTSSQLIIPSLQFKKCKSSKVELPIQQTKSHIPTQTQNQIKKKKKNKTNFKGLTYIAEHYLGRGFSSTTSTITTPKDKDKDNTLPTSQCFYINNHFLTNNPPSLKNTNKKIGHTATSGFRPSLKEYHSSANILTKYSLRYPLIEENIDIIEANPMLYNLNTHLKKKKREVITRNCTKDNETDNDNDFAKLEYLRGLAFDSDYRDEYKGRNDMFKTLRDNCFSGSLTNLNSMYRNYKETDKVIIDNEKIDKKNIDVIAKKILRKCNYIHSKSIYNNTCLRKGEGKMMITAGMSVNEFNMKYLMK